MQNNNNNFMDTKTITAIILVGAVWFGWQSYLSKKYPAVNTAPTKQVESKPVDVEKPSAANIVPEATTAPQSVVNEKKVEAVESKIPVSSDLADFSFSSKGMSLKNFNLKTFKNKDGSQIVFDENAKGLFTLLLNNEPVDFIVSQKSSTEFSGTASIGGLNIQRNIVYNPETYSFVNEIKADGDLDGKTLTISIADTKKEFGSGHVLFPSYEFQEFFVQHEEEKTERLNITTSKEAINSTFKIAKVGSIDSHYFTTGLVDQSEVIPDVHVANSGKEIDLNFIYKFLPGVKSSVIKFTSYVGPRDLKLLEKANPALGGLVNYGFFGFIAKPLLKTMKWFYGVVGNWGIAIILLTLLVRLIVLPLHIMSFKSMKSMQKVQPLITALREKYKDDPTTLNKEMMELMRNHKVNPLGGCLPMLMQIPVFFALYQVFGQSIDLYQAPFGLWILDLSSKDPYYVLPVLMSVVMFLQQKMTPTTMDPTQAKIMAFMPVIFSVFMLSLPSALTLYMFVSTLFGVIQQFLFLRDKSSAIAIKEAKA